MSGGDDDVCAWPPWMRTQNRLAIVLVNYRFRFAVRRHVQLKIDKLPPSLAGGQWRESTIDPLHSNVFTDASHCELEMTASGMLDPAGSFTTTKRCCRIRLYCWSWSAKPSDVRGAGHGDQIRTKTLAIRVTNDRI